MRANLLGQTARLTSEKLSYATGVMLWPVLRRQEAGGWMGMRERTGDEGFNFKTLGAVKSPSKCGLIL